MPTLILSSRYTTESKILRKAAEALQWPTFRLEDDQVPAWYVEEKERRDSQHAIHCTRARSIAMDGYGHFCFCDETPFRHAVGGVVASSSHKLIL